MVFDARTFLESLYADRVVAAEPERPVRHGVLPGDLPPDWRVEWEERAAIREYDGGQAREHAEAEALTEVLARMRAAGVISDLP